jgi:hypothetical protein
MESATQPAWRHRYRVPPSCSNTERADQTTNKPDSPEAVIAVYSMEHGIHVHLKFCNVDQLLRQVRARAVAYHSLTFDTAHYPS